MTVRSILLEKGHETACVGQDTPISKAVALLDAKDIGALVVSDDRKTIQGIISERDVVLGLRILGANVLDKPVSKFMTRDVFTCSPGDSILSIMELMTDKHIRHVPVLNDGELAGIISIGDVVKGRLDEVERESGAMLRYIRSA